MAASSKTSTPFIYIASLRRTGSTVVAEALTQWPYSFIFREPGLGRNKHNFKDDDIESLREHGVDVEKFVRSVLWKVKLNQLLRTKRDVMVKSFATRLAPQLGMKVQQFGVKEIRHEGWRRYLRAFPGMKVVLTGRDPRDIYISLYYRLNEERGKRWRGAFEPAAVAQDLNSQFRHQVNMHEQVGAFKAKYEDVCTDPEVLERLKQYVESPIPAGDVGEVGGFLAGNPRRQEEHQVHGDQITDKRVRRWAQETNEQLVADAHRAFDLMPEYCEFWKYERG